MSPVRLVAVVDTLRIGGKDDEKDDELAVPLHGRTIITLLDY